MIDSVRGWECPRCDQTRATPGNVAGTPMHDCPGLHMMSVPMVRAGADADVRLVERGDYVGEEDVRLDEDGRAWMASTVTHADGREDRFVYAPTAYLNASAEWRS